MILSLGAVLLLCQCSDNKKVDLQPYIDYMQSDSLLSLKNSGFNNYALVYIDDDDIPEMVLDGQCEANGYIVLAVHDGKVSKLETWRHSFTYIPRSGLCGYYNGWIDDHEWYHVFRLKDGQFTKIMDYDIRFQNYDDYVAGKPDSSSFNGKLVGDTPREVFADSVKHFYFDRKDVVDVDSASWIPCEELK